MGQSAAEKREDREEYTVTSACLLLQLVGRHPLPAPAPARRAHLRQARNSLPSTTSAKRASTPLPSSAGMSAPWMSREPFVLLEDEPAEDEHTAEQQHHRRRCSRREQLSAILAVLACLGLLTSSWLHAQERVRIRVRVRVRIRVRVRPPATATPRRRRRSARQPRTRA